MTLAEALLTVKRNFVKLCKSFIINAFVFHLTIALQGKYGNLKQKIYVEESC